MRMDSETAPVFKYVEFYVYNLIPKYSTDLYIAYTMHTESEHNHARYTQHAYAE